MPDITIGQRLRHAWNAFKSDEPSAIDIGPGSSTRMDRVVFRHGNEKSIIASVYNRLGIDVSSIPFKHVRLDKNGEFVDTIDSGLNTCLTVEANIDQSGRALVQDITESLCDEGTVAIVPVETKSDPKISSSFEILSLRTAKIVQWYPEHVRVSLYDQITGIKREITLPKRMVAIVENPLYPVMNAPNSTLRRLIAKLNLLDAIDNQSGSGRLDLIIQLPYTIKTDTRREQAEKRRKDLETQLKDSKYGIAYTDGTEKVTQLNRPAENNLMDQIEYLTVMLYGQLGLTKEVFEGTADEATMQNYYGRTIEPFASAIADAMSRSFITKTGRSQGQAIIHMRDPFRYVPPTLVPQMADLLTRNKIATPNEMRVKVGLKPSSDPDADKLQNNNIAPTQQGSLPASAAEDKTNQNGRKDKLNAPN